ncbi:MAG TPA: efflux RND transporter periplasmic adaptor subunit [Bryobacteraceae bacterium]|jgi:multidrug efflux pump subunit AcrA (membrane-fusion protein)|nr:efflux RND transporter periplasmic adaptor subunit [Bryobacteraceae bacterium]
MKKSWLCAVLAAALLASACSKKEEAETEAPAPVQVTGVTQEPIRRIVPGDGVLFPVGQSTIMPALSKPVVKFYVNRGDHVKEGQLLATLENRDLQASVDNFKAQVNQASLNLHSTELATVPEAVVKAKADVQSDTEQVDAAKKLLDSQQKLFDEGALAGRRVDEARVAYASAKAQLEGASEHLRALQSVSKDDQIATAKAQLQSAQAQLAAAQAQLSYSEIHSPRSGIVADRPVYPGEMAAAGAPLLTVIDISKVVARVNIPQNQIATVKVGQTAEVAPADNGAPVEGRVTVVSPATDPASTTAQVWVECDNPGEQLKPGASVHVQIVTELVKNATTVPSSAILPGEEGGTAVLVIDSDSIAHRHAVTTGIREGDKVQIVNGVRPGDEVVVVGGLGVDDKAKVRKIDTTVQESDDDDNAPDASKDAAKGAPKDQKKDEAKPKQ